MELLNLTRRAGASQIMQALQGGSKTFGELAQLISVHTLQRRLDEFMRSGWVVRRVLPDRRVEYSLSNEGFELATKLVTLDKTLAGNLKTLMGEWYEGFMQEWAAYWSRREELLAKYAGRYVAICGAEVATVSNSFHQAAIEARRKCGPRPVYVVKVGEELTPHLIRSPKVQAHEAPR